MSAARRSRHPLPADLMRRVPFQLLMIFESHRFFTGFGFVLCLFMIYGPLPLRLADHNAYRYLLGPLVFPALALASLLAFPVRPLSRHPGAPRGHGRPGRAG
jgi:hypothetical protein